MQNFFVNKRMLIYGPAGTGKTLLAMEQCRRLRAEGKKVLYVCYNRLIANSVREKFNEGLYLAHWKQMPPTNNL